MSSEPGGGRDGLIVTGAVLVNGGLGYLIQIVAGLLLTATEYRDFGVVWAAVFFVAGALTGLQQEVTRDVRRGGEGTSLARVATAVALVIGVPLAVAALLLPEGSSTLWPMAAAAVAIGVHGVVTGAAYGTAEPRWAALALVLEGGIRAALLLVVIVAAGGSALPLGLGIALPFLAAALLVLPGLRRRTGPVRLAAAPRRVVGNIAQTLLASAASAALVSGYPMFLALLTSPTAQELGAFVFAFTLTRAPLVVVMLGLQSFLIAAFRDRRPPRATILAAIGAIVVGVAALAALAALAAPWILERFFDPGFALEGATLFWIVLSAAPLCVLCVTGPLALARGRHRTFATGWIAAAAVAVAGLALGGLLQLPFLPVAVMAIMAGPTVGALAHAAGLRAR
ncbi:hypothetical protein [Agrococcus sp. HG114]|uniref:hypothetical protein n=1 Tax=Agrococcus sp. HG114 TaxID=2969757 RepID=UPI00215B123A|nr:hypothetical protein [Agrococcus sp. HG114]MCR8670422.1 hypothetical protein [Agrococcus sp. HG114]